MPGVEKRNVALKTILKIIVGLTVVVVVVVFARFVFMNASRLGWTLGWIYMGIITATFAINLVCLRLWNPELTHRRIRFGKFIKNWDILWGVLSAFAIIAVFVVASKEAGNGVSREPGVSWLLGLAIFISGWALVNWSMVVNPFFEKTVRIQTEHGHHVIDSGPYAYLRHPGYLGFSGWILSTPLLLASNWAFIPALILVVLLVVRTALEDHMLHVELPGYSVYAARVRFRLIPGIW